MVHELSSPALATCSYGTVVTALIRLQQVPSHTDDTNDSLNTHNGNKERGVSPVIYTDVAIWSRDVYVSLAGCGHT